MPQRPDGRRPDEPRPVRFLLDDIEYSEGSVLVEMSRTRVLCNLSAEADVLRWLAGSGSGWLTAEYALPPCSTHSRTARETLRPGGRTEEICRFIGRALTATADLERLGERTLMLACDVLRADGGTRTALEETLSLAERGIAALIASQREALS